MVITNLVINAANPYALRGADGLLDMAIVQPCLLIGCGRVEEPFVGDCLGSSRDTIVHRKISPKAESDRKYIRFIKSARWRLDCVIAGDGEPSNSIGSCLPLGDS